MTAAGNSIPFRIVVLLCSAGVAFAAEQGAKAEGVKEKEPELFEAAPRKMQLFSLFPTGGRRGATVDVEVLGANLDRMQRVEFGCKGVKAEILSSTYLSAHVRFALAAD